MGKKKEILSFYKDIINVDNESIIKLSNSMIAFIIYMLPINKSKNEKAPSYRKKLDKQKAYSKLKEILGIENDIIVNDNNYKAKKVDSIENNTIYIQYGSYAYLDRFTEGLRNAFAHGNVYKNKDKLIIYNVKNGCKRISLYFETTEYNLEKALRYYYKNICEDDAKVRIINEEIEQLCQE